MKKVLFQYFVIFMLISSIAFCLLSFCFTPFNTSDVTNVKNEVNSKNKKNVKEKKKKNNSISNVTLDEEEQENDYDDLENDYIEEDDDEDTALPDDIENDFVRLESYNIKVSKTNIIRGEESYIEITYNPEDATYQDTTYESTNKNVAIVSQEGVITGVNRGECYIVVNVLNASSGKIKITVSNNNEVVSTDTTKSDDNYYSSNSSTNKNINSQYSSNTTESSTNSNSVSSYNQSTNSSTSSQSQNKITKETVSIDEEENELVNEDVSYENIPTLSEEDVAEEKTTTTNSTKTNETKKVIKNGWYIVNGKKYYFKNNKKLKNTYVNYIYLNKNGVAQAKIGKFSATLYGAKAWANQKLSIRKKYNSSSIIGTVPAGGKMQILSACKSNNYIKIKYNNKIGYVNSNYIYINLPDVIPDMKYAITNSSGSIFKSKGYNIPNVTGRNLYGFKKQYNSKIGKTTYYAPMLFPVARQIQTAYNKARSQGYNLKVYDTYRPYHVTKSVSSNFRKLYNSNKKVKKSVNYDRNGQYWGTSWFLAQKASRHNNGTAVDLALTNSSGKELSAQTKMHTLDTRSLTKYNNKVAKKLRSIMTSSGFETLKSEWWHFQENSYKSSKITNFNIR